MDELAVDQSRVDRELAESMRKLGKFGGPVEPAAGDQPDLAMLDAGEQAIAVVFDLVQPFGAGRRRVRGSGELRLQIDRHWPFSGASNSVRRVSRGYLALSGIPDPVAIVGDRFERAAAFDTEGVVHDHGVTALGHRRVVTLFDQEPVR